jgi:hypothetical protein
MVFQPGSGALLVVSALRYPVLAEPADITGIPGRKPGHRAPEHLPDQAIEELAAKAPSLHEALEKAVPDRSRRGDGAVAETQLVEEECVPVCCLVDDLVEGPGQVA